LKKLTKYIFAFLGSILFSISTVAADGVKLFDATQFLTHAEETALLNAEEAETLRLHRSKTDVYANSKVIKVNEDAFNSNTIKLVTTDGRELQYTGAIGTEEGSKCCWFGNSSTRRGYFSMSVGKDGGYGDVHEGDKIYQIIRLQGKKLYLISEVIFKQTRNDTSNLSFSAAVAAALLTLFDETYYLTPSEETASLTAEEAEAVRLHRTKTDVYTNSKIVKLNEDVFNGNTITLVTPDGQELQYTGEMGTDDGNKCCWFGNSSTRRGYFSMFVGSRGGYGGYGEIHEGNKVYQITRLQSKNFYLISEVIVK
jgi:hypothetical protein